MDLQTIQTFFMWCTVLNGTLLILTGIILTFAGNAVYRIQSRWYPISKDAFKAKNWAKSLSFALEVLGPLVTSVAY